MGLFSSKKTYVSSTIYNMAGPIEDRPNFLKTLIVNSVLGVGSGSIAEQLQGGYVRGPGTRVRNFGRWAKDNYTLVGIPRGNLYSRPEVSAEAVAAHIPHGSGETVSIQRVETKLGDYAYWAEQWMMEHYPLLLGSNWVSDYDETLNKISITFEDGTTAEFNPTDFRKSSAYIYAVYNLLSGSEAEPVQTGQLTILNDGQVYPTTSGWGVDQNTTRKEDVLLTKIVQETITYSDNRPAETKTTNSVVEDSYNYYRGQFSKTTYEGAEATLNEELRATKEIMYHFRDGTVDVESSTSTKIEELEGGVAKTIKTDTTEEVLNVVQSYRVDTQKLIIQSTSRPKMFIYRLGSGNTELDNLVEQDSDDGYYYPFIPVRLDNKMLQDINPDAYAKTEKAYKRATSGKLDPIVDGLKENKSIKDIDYAYIMFGVSLNTKEATGRRYLFDFFERVRLSQPTNGAYGRWAALQDQFGTKLEELNDWRLDQQDSTSSEYGEEPPVLPGLLATPVSEIRITGAGTLPSNLDIQISWQTISKVTGTGLARTGAKKGDCWIETGSTAVRNQSLLVAAERLNLSGLRSNQVVITRQLTNDTWAALTIIGLVHKNYIYKGKFVEIEADDALKDAEESGFLVPLHYETFRDMSLVDSTQLASACCYMVINSYLVKKTGFFQSTFFKILLVVVVIAIVVATGGAAAPGAAGLLGSSAAVGAAIGLTGTLALIAGAIANALVAMIVSKIITMGAVALFGDKLGTIIGTIAAVVAMQVGTAVATGSSLAASISNLAQAQNLIALSASVGNGIAGYIQAGAMETVNKINKLQEDYAKETNRINDAFENEFGLGGVELDPWDLMGRNQFTVESPGTFLDRTLLTGSDIAQMSMDMLTNFADITLNTELPK